MKQLQTQPLAASAGPMPHIALWQANLLRVGYLVLGLGLAAVKSPLLVHHSSWTLEEGTIECLLVAMSLLALVGVRYPLRMLPVLLFEVIWKAIWLGLVALPLWADHRLEGATRVQTGAVLWVVVIALTIPWRHVVAHYVTAPVDPWRRRR